jgi:hypothetical protein
VVLCPAVVNQGAVILQEDEQCFSGTLLIEEASKEYNFEFNSVGISLHFQTLK